VLSLKKGKISLGDKMATLARLLVLDKNDLQFISLFGMLIVFFDFSSGTFYSK